MTDRSLQLPEGVPTLTTFYVYLTAGCNLACRHCWISPSYQPNGGSGGHLDFDLFKLAIDEGLPLGLTNVKLTGGEPLLHPSFIGIVDYLKRMNLNLIIETNGTLMTSSLAEYLKDKSTLGFISVSLDGANAETHDVFRGVKGSFDKACLGIRNLVQVGYHPQVIMSLHNGNVDEIEPLVQLADQLGAGSVKFNLIQPTGRGELMSERGQILNVPRLIELGKWVESDLQKRSQIPLYYSWPIAFYNLRRLLTDSSSACGILNILGILSTGQLAMCGIGMEIPELCYGSLGVDSIDEIWYNSPNLISLRHDLLFGLEGICGVCIFRSQCLGSCVAYNYHHTKRLNASHWFCQQAENGDLFPHERIQVN